MSGVAKMPQGRNTCNYRNITVLIKMFISPLRQNTNTNADANTE